MFRIWFKFELFEKDRCLQRRYLKKGKHNINNEKEIGPRFTWSILCSYPARTIRAAFKLAANLLCTWLEAATGGSMFGKLPPNGSALFTAEGSSRSNLAIRSPA